MIDHREVFHSTKTFIADIKVKISENPLISSKKKLTKIYVFREKKIDLNKLFFQNLTPREPSSLCFLASFYVT